MHFVTVASVEKLSEISEFLEDYLFLSHPHFHQNRFSQLLVYFYMRQPLEGPEVKMEDNEIQVMLFQLQFKAKRQRLSKELFSLQLFHARNEPLHIGKEEIIPQWLSYNKQNEFQQAVSSPMAKNCMPLEFRIFF